VSQAVNQGEDCCLVFVQFYQAQTANRHLLFSLCVHLVHALLRRGIFLPPSLSPRFIFLLLPPPGKESIYPSHTPPIQHNNSCYPPFFSNSSFPRLPARPSIIVIMSDRPGVPVVREVLVLGDAGVGKMSLIVQVWQSLSSLSQPCVLCFIFGLFKI
jgi:hypothetical protein